MRKLPTLKWLFFGALSLSHQIDVIFLVCWWWNRERNTKWMSWVWELRFIFVKRETSAKSTFIPSNQRSFDKLMPNLQNNEFKHAIEKFYSMFFHLFVYSCVCVCSWTHLQFTDKFMVIVRNVQICKSGALCGFSKSTEKCFWISFYLFCKLKIMLTRLLRVQ